MSAGPASFEERAAATTCSPLPWTLPWTNDAICSTVVYTVALSSMKGSDVAAGSFALLNGAIIVGDANANNADFDSPVAQAFNKVFDTVMTASEIVSGQRIDRWRFEGIDKKQ